MKARTSTPLPRHREWSGFLLPKKIRFSYLLLSFDFRKFSVEFMKKFVTVGGILSIPISMYWYFSTYFMSPFLPLGYKPIPECATLD